MERVLGEANTVFVPEVESAGPDYAAFKDLSYSANALKEALRKYAIVPVVTRQVHHRPRCCPCADHSAPRLQSLSFSCITPRQAVEDDVIGRYQIPAGTRVIVPIIAIHQNAELWPQPTAFRPERFETSPPHAYAWLGAPPLPAIILCPSCVDSLPFSCCPPPHPKGSSTGLGRVLANISPSSSPRSC